MKYITASLIILLFASCHKPVARKNEITPSQGERYYKRETIRKLAKGDLNLPLQYGFLFAFVKFPNNELGRTNINELRNTYLKHYKSKFETYDQFLFEALNQYVVLAKNQMGKGGNIVYFKVDSVITKDLHGQSIDHIISKYCDPSFAKDKFYIKHRYKGEQLNTILYLFSIRGYSISVNDMLGRYDVYR